MVKIIGTAVIAAAMLVALPAFAKDKAGDMACCAKNASNQQLCTNLASLNLTADQNSKIEAWQSECMKAGSPQESRHAFLKKPERLLPKDHKPTFNPNCNKSTH